MGTGADERSRAAKQGVGERAQGSQVVDDPDAAAVRAEDQVAGAGLHDHVAHGDGREVVGFELRPVFAAIDAGPEAELGAHEEERRIQGVFADNVGVTAQALLRAGDTGPGLAVISGAINPRVHVAEGVAVEGGIGGARRKAARLHPVHPAVLGQAAHVGDEVVPVLSAVAGELQVAIVGADPDEPGGERRLADRGDRGVHLGDRVVDRDATRLLLLLLLRVVGRQVRREALPALPVIARAEQELRANVERCRVVWREGDWGVPVETQLVVALEVFRPEPRLDGTRFVRAHVHTADVAAL